MYKVLITGGNGVIGKELQKTLKEHNCEVRILTRTPEKDNEFYWNIENDYIDIKAFEKITHIVHLAGAGIADKRWSQQRKNEISKSRVHTANLLYKYTKKTRTKLKGFISAGGIGYYGSITTNKIYTENDQPFSDFISKVCIEWEESAQQFKKLNVPVTIFRTGVVLSKKGGALSKMNTPIFLTPLGIGNQYIPWIHLNDLCLLFTKAILENGLTGVYNAVAPEHHTNNSFTKAISKITNKPLLPIGIPKIFLKLMLGELSTLVLNGSRISSKKTEKHHTFIFPTLQEALNNLLKSN